MAVQLGCKREDETGYVHDSLTTGKSLHWVWQLNWDTSTWVTLDLCMTDCPQAKLILSKAVQVEYKHVDDLASVWCEWAEMELRYEWVNCHAATQNCCILHFSLSSLSPPPPSLLLLSSTHCPHPCRPSQGQRIGDLLICTALIQKNCKNLSIIYECMNTLTVVTGLIENITVNGYLCSTLFHGHSSALHGVDNMH